MPLILPFPFARRAAWFHNRVLARIGRLIAAAFVGCALFALGPQADAASATLPQIWFAPLDNGYRDFLKDTGSPDFMELFGPTAPWPEVRRTINAFKLYTGFVVQASDTDFHTVIDFLRRHRIPLALETQILTPIGKCGSIEGYAEDARNNRAYQRIHDAGGVVAYIAMDEPLYYGNIAARGCHSSIDDLAENAARRITSLKVLFPDVQIGDIEPPTGFTLQEINEFLPRWAHAFRQATGSNLAFFHSDIVWDRPWTDRLQTIIGILDTLSIPSGVIYNAAPMPDSDISWANAVTEHTKQVEVFMGRHPDQVIFQSWVKNPRHVLPENAPGSFTNVILTYLRRQAREVPKHLAD